MERCPSRFSADEMTTSSIAPGARGTTARSIAAIFAHPDDETFAAGALLARLAAEGTACHLFCATDGNAGRTSGVAVSSRAELGERRRAELRDAAAVLRLTSVHAPGHPDGRLAEVDADSLIGEVVALLRRRRPDIVVTFGPEGGRNTHRDHRAISRAATAAFFLAGLATSYPEQLGGDIRPCAPSRLYYSAWPPPEPGEELQARGLPVTARIDARPYNDVKLAAFLAHETQREHRERFESLALTEYEMFALAAGSPQPRGVVEDLFEGL